MNLATAAVHVATVHFLGLCLFTPPPNQTIASATERVAPQFVVIMPYVPRRIGIEKTPVLSADARRIATDKRSAIGSTPQPDITLPQADHLHVQPHAALLIVKHSDVLAVTGWATTPIQYGYDTIQLNGEHLSFVSDGPNQAITRKLALGHVSGRLLRPEYQPPAYSDAAAVFTITKGELAACSKDPLLPDGSVPLMSRIDTELKLKNSGQFTIQAGTKSLTVKGDATVVAANVPPSYATGENSAASGLPHYTVYCGMVTGGGACEAPMPVLSDADTSTPPIKQCQDHMMAMGGERRVAPVVPPHIDKLLDFACSDSQFP